MKKPAKKASPKAASVRVKAAPGVATPGTGGRRASVSRATKETRISAAINLDGTSKYDIQTGIGFLDHMLEQLSRHSLIDITVRAEGDLHIDYHHTTEDTGIVLGECLQKALGDRAGIRRYGSAVIPMDETLTEVALDASNRPYLIWKVDFSKPKLGSMDTELFKEWFQAFAQLGGLTLHVWNHYGDNNHHIVESCFKGLARALRVAVEIDPSARHIIDVQTATRDALMHPYIAGHGYACIRVDQRGSGDSDGVLVDEYELVVLLVGDVGIEQDAEVARVRKRVGGGAALCGSVRSRSG